MFHFCSELSYKIAKNKFRHIFCLRNIPNNNMNSSDFTYLNQSNQLNYTDNVEEENDWEVPRIILLSFKPVVMVFGTFGNLLSFAVMRRGSLKDVSTCFYMSMLSLADTGQFGDFLGFLSISIGQFSLNAPSRKSTYL